MLDCSSLSSSQHPEQSMPKLMIVIGSTRPGRAGISVAEWFIEHAARARRVRDRSRRSGRAQPAAARRAQPSSPAPVHPPHTRAWSEQVDAADAFVFITPEYNHGYPAALKNAIDYLHWEWTDKPIGFVSYGGVAAGTRALQQLKPVVSVLKLRPGQRGGQPSRSSPSSSTRTGCSSPTRSWSSRQRRCSTSSSASSPRWPRFAAAHSPLGHDVKRARGLCHGLRSRGSAARTARSASDPDPEVPPRVG